LPFFGSFRGRFRCPRVVAEVERPVILNRQQACGVFGLTRAEFDKAVKAGLPARKKSASRGEDWIVDAAAAHKWLVAQALAAAGLVAAGAAPLDLEQQKARHSKAQADRLELEIRRLRGELAPVAEIKAALSAQDVAVRDRLMAVPHACAARVVEAAPKGEVAVARAIDAEIRAALTALSSAECVPAVRQ
jgi:phage terminase Nu1 subunit (DNA packaging protein)